MKSKILGIILIVLGMILPSCEVDMPLQQEGIMGYALNSVVNTDTTLIAYVSNCYSIGGIVDERVKALDDKLYSYIFTGNVVSGNYYNEYRSKGPVNTADITYFVNGQEMGKMVLVEEEYHSNYVASYRPKEGDVISFMVKDFFNAAINVEASTKVPEKSRFEIVDIERMYMAKEGKIWESELSDTVVKITVRLHDPAGEKNYYRLKVRSKRNGIVEGIYANDVFWTDDPLFFDENLWQPVGNWRTGTTPFFDDSGFDGEDREFTVYHRPMMKTNYISHAPYECFVDVQSITADVYLHQKSLISYMQSGESVYGEPLYIHSNTSSGFGIVGGMTSNRHHIENFISIEQRRGQQ